jgi:hypothetical protein
MGLNILQVFLCEKYRQIEAKIQGESKFSINQRILLLKEAYTLFSIVLKLLQEKKFATIVYRPPSAQSPSEDGRRIILLPSYWST